MILNKGTKIDDIEVVLSYRIIELFSAGLYSSPNKAFEELVCNSYDAYAKKVAVYVDSDLSTDNSYIWVCDDGRGMDHLELKDLWKVGESTKKRENEENAERLEIGRFGIGKLSTYILAHNLTYICKKNGRFIAVKMDYSRIHKDSGERLILDEIELSEDEAKLLLAPYLRKGIPNLLPFELFGKEAVSTWTFSIMTNLKPKAMDIKEGRLKWILQTALPLNPDFKLWYNGHLVESSKINKPISKSWIIGKDDETAEKMECEIYEEKGSFYIDFPNLKRVHGECVLYEDSLVTGKSTDLGRSHGIFLMVRGRLINLDDPLLGMEAFSHGAFNRTRITIYADELDNNITSTRETIKESAPFNQLKAYLKKKFNNEIKRFYFDKESKRERESSISYRLSQVSSSLSRAPLVTFARKAFDNEITNSWLIKNPSIENAIEIDTFLKKLEEDVENNDFFTDNTSWENLMPEDPIAYFNIESRVLTINLMHPFIANFYDQFKSRLPIEFIAITEILTEAHLYEISISEEHIASIMKRRDKILRELVFSDRVSAPIVAQILKDSLSDAVGLEDAVYKAFLTLGFETQSVGGPGKPDGVADAILGYTMSEHCENYRITYDAKSTKNNKIQAGTARFSALNRHKADYKANFSVIVAVDFEGADDPDSAINKEAKQQKITVFRAKDLMKLLLLAVPKQLGLKELRSLFEECYTPNEVKCWVDNLEKKEIKRGPINELLDVIYDLQKNDQEPPEIASIRITLKNTGITLSTLEIKNLIESIKVLVPGFINIEETKVSINSKPEVVKQAIQSATNDVPPDLQQLYIEALCN